MSQLSRAASQEDYFAWLAGLVNGERIEMLVQFQVRQERAKWGPHPERVVAERLRLRLRGRSLGPGVKVRAEWRTFQKPSDEEVERVGLTGGTELTLTDWDHPDLLAQRVEEARRLFILGGVGAAPVERRQELLLWIDGQPVLNPSGASGTFRLSLFEAYAAQSSSTSSSARCARELWGWEVSSLPEYLL